MHLKTNAHSYPKESLQAKQYASTTGSPYYRLLEKLFVQGIIFRSFTYHCVVLLSSFHLYSQPIRVIIHEIKTFEKSTRKQGSEK